VKLSTGEFLRRFCLHILPPRFMKIRHYGLVGNHQRREKIIAARAVLGSGEPAGTKSTASVEARGSVSTAEVAGETMRGCPQCGSLRLIRVRHELPARRSQFDSS
jgi:hypothetical protein